MSENEWQWTMSKRIGVYVAISLILAVLPISIPIYIILHSIALGFILGQLWQWKGASQNWWAVLICVLVFLWCAIYKPSVNSGYFG